jgi:hypothetical protein
MMNLITTSSIVKNNGAEFCYLSPGKCKECGEEIKTDCVDWRFAEPMIKKCVCQKCSFWLEHAEHRDKFTVIIEEDDGSRRHYRVGREQKNVPSFCKGFGGQRFKIRFLDGRFLETTNLWHQGIIPERFYDRLPVNAEFVYK